jgi:uncharacterized membrane protein
MLINNPLKLNDWEMNKFIGAVLLIQFTFIFSVLLDIIGLHIPILREFLGFIYLTFIPGVLLLRVMRLHELDSVTTLLYSVGLSLASLMFLGFFINILFPLLRIHNPISLVLLMLTINVFTLVLCGLSYIIDKNFNKKPSLIDTKILFSNKVGFLCLIPFLAILGTYLMNSYGNSIILMILIIVIGLIFLLSAFDKFSQKLYPLIIFVISLSLLFYVSLISNQLFGWDIQVEYYVAQSVILNSIWNFNLWGNVNSMLSISILAPIYSILLKMNLIWVFKIIYPLIFALLPLGLYEIFKSQTNDKIALLSCFFFISFYVFFNEMIQLGRQEIAELFLVLLILLLITKSNNKINSILFVVFSLSLAVSHYGLSYIYMILLISVFLILYLLDIPQIGEIKGLRFIISRIKDNSPSFLNEYRNITLNLVLLFVVFSIGWYLFISGSSPFTTILNIGNQISNSIFTGFFNLSTLQGLKIIQQQTATPLHNVGKIIQLISQFFIVIGLLTLFLKKDKINLDRMKFNTEYIIFSFVCLFILIAAISVPFFASALNTSRLYQITLIFLAPFCVLGVLSILDLLKTILKRKWKQKSFYGIFAVFLVIFLLFNTGFAYEIAGDASTSFSLNKNFDAPVFNTNDIFGVTWLHNYKNSTIPVYADGYRVELFNEFELYNANYILMNLTIPNSSYIYLGHYNIHNDKLLIYSNQSTGEYIPNIIVTENKNKIYDNGGFQIWN